MADIAAPERTLPHSLDAEKSVLGAILVRNEAFNHAAELIDSRDCFRDAHRRIFESMVGLSERGDPIDFITLKEELSKSGELEDVGGPAYIAALADVPGVLGHGSHRIAVTGLQRSGKNVFVTSFVHALLHAAPISCRDVPSSSRGTAPSLPSSVAASS